MKKMFYFIIPLITIAVAMLGNVFTSIGMDWYQTLNLPPVASPGIYIGLVWTVIFILSAIAVAIFWKDKKKNQKTTPWIVALLIVNALLNVFWSLVFFVWHFLGWAIVEMVVLNLVNLALIILFWRKSRVSAYLWFPYFLWVSFATYLATQIWLLNF